MDEIGKALQACLLSCVSADYNSIQSISYRYIRRHDTLHQSFEARRAPSWQSKSNQEVSDCQGTEREGLRFGLGFEDLWVQGAPAEVDGTAPVPNSTQTAHHHARIEVCLFHA